MFVDTATDIEVRIYHEVVSVQLEVTDFRFKFIFHTIEAVLHDCFYLFLQVKIIIVMFHGINER